MRFPPPEFRRSIEGDSSGSTELREKLMRRPVNHAGTERVSTAPDANVGRRRSRNALLTSRLDREAPHRVFDAYILNIDATVFAGAQLMPELKMVVDTLTSLRRPIRYLSMMSTVSSDALAKAMGAEGVQIDPHEIVTPGRQAARYLHKSYPGASVFVIGDDGLAGELDGRGIASKSGGDRRRSLDTTVSFRSTK